MRLNLSAHTSLGSNYPSYLSINQLPEGSVEFTVRSPRTLEGWCGTTSAMLMTPQEARKVLTEALEALQEA
jgi:hypothetical protein